MSQLASEINPLEERVTALEFKLSQLLEYLRDHFDENLYQAHATAVFLNTKLQKLERTETRSDIAKNTLDDLVPFRASF